MGENLNDAPHENYLQKYFRIKITQSKTKTLFKQNSSTKKIIKNIHVLPQHVYNFYCNNTNFTKNRSYPYLNSNSSYIRYEMKEPIPEESEKFLIPYFLDIKKILACLEFHVLQLKLIGFI